MSDQNNDRLRDHAFDGIREYDNKLPNWWLMILFGSIVFAIGYWLVFHSFKIADLPRAKYQKEMAQAAQAQLEKMSKQGVTDESLQLMSTIPEQVAAGHEIFKTYCIVCHADKGQGLVGPNLTDAYWLHGGRPTQILHTVTNGVPSKGMAAWGRQLGPTRVQKVVAFVLSIRDTNVPGKAPQGEKYVPAAADSTAGAASDSTSAAAPAAEETEGNG